MKSNSPIFSSVAYAFGIIYKKKLSNWIMKLSLFSSFYIFSTYISSFRSLIHLIFVHGVGYRFNFFLFHVDIKFSQHLLKRLPLLHWLVLARLSKIIWPYVQGFISGLSSVLLVYIICLCHYHTVLITVAL